MLAPVSTNVSPAQRSRLREVARKVFWWGNPEGWLDQETRFLAQVMTYGDWRDVTATLEIVGEERFRETLSHAPAGVFDNKSWHYWHNRFGISPIPPLPTRKL